MSEPGNSAAKERVLQMAEQLFMERGYASVKLKDIAAALNMRTASLYNHAPGGKEQLFVEVTERNLLRHRQGLEQAISLVEPVLRAQLRAAALWFLEQAPVDLARMVRSDMPALEDQAHARRLMLLSYQALMLPIINVLEQARQRGEIRAFQPQLISSVFVSAIQNLHDAVRFDPAPKAHWVEEVLALFLDGLLPR